MFKMRGLLHSFKYAIQGLVYVWQNEQNFRIQCGVAAAVIVGMIGFRVSLAEAIVLTMMIVFVLVLEVMNTIFEKMVDILKPRLHTYVKVIKDMMAAVVLLAAIGSAIVAAMVFIPYCVDLLNLLH